MAIEDLFYAAAQRRRTERRFEKFVQRAETEGWDSRTTLLEAAKRGITDNPHVQAYVQQKQIVENEGLMRQQRQAIVRGPTRTRGILDDVAANPPADPILEGATELARKKQQPAGVLLMEGDPNRRTGFQPEIRYDTVRERSVMDGIPAQGGPTLAEQDPAMRSAGPGVPVPIHPAYHPETNPVLRLKEIPTVETAIMQVPGNEKLIQLRTSAQDYANDLDRMVQMEIYTPKEAMEKAIVKREALEKAAAAEVERVRKERAEKEKFGAEHEREIEKIRLKGEMDRLTGKARGAGRRDYNTLTAKDALDLARRYSADADDVEGDAKGVVARQIANNYGITTADPGEVAAILRGWAAVLRHNATIKDPTIRPPTAPGGAGGGTGRSASDFWK